MNGDELEPFDGLAGYVGGRDRLFLRLTKLLADDPRVAAAWLSGSFGRNEADEWADFDLHVAIHDEHFKDFLNFRPAMYERIALPILVQDDMASDSLPGGRFQLVVFAGAVEVDWNIGPLSKAVRPLAHKMLIERADVPLIAPKALSSDQRRAYAQRSLTFFWAMAQIAAKYAGRGDTRRAVVQIDLLSGAFIALWRLTHDADAIDPMLHAANRILEDEVNDRLPRVASTIDAPATVDVIDELCRQVVALHQPLAALGVQPPEEVASEMRRLITLVRGVLAATTPAPPHKFR